MKQVFIVVSNTDGTVFGVYTTEQAAEEHVETVAEKGLVIAIHDVWVNVPSYVYTKS